MLPSGNDAAIVLADYFGNILFKNGDLQVLLDIIIKPKSDADRKGNCRVKQKYFLMEMNRLARELSLSNTKFANPHGLINNENKSTTRDIAILCYQVIKVWI